MNVVGSLFATASASAHWPLLALQWLLACAGGLATGCVIWLLLNGAARVWPALRTQRGVWLAAQAVVALATLLPMLPTPAPLPNRPQIDIAQPTTLAATAASLSLSPLPSSPSTSPSPSPSPQASHTHPIANADARHAAPTTPMTAATPSAIPSPATITRALPLLAALWLLIYTAGLARAIHRQWQARRLWRGLLATAHRVPADELQAHYACSAQQLTDIHQHKLTVMRIDAPISPMLLGVRRPLLLLPARLDTLNREQQQMIIAHELQHLRMRDPLYLSIAAAMQTILWFIPALRWMATQMEWALELRCDQHVLTGRPQHQRKQYASALIQQWKQQTIRQPASAAAFDGAAINTRIRSMQRDSLPTLSATAKTTIAATLTAIAVASTALQPALAYQAPATAPAPTTTAATTTAEPWRYPLDKVRVTSLFGVTRSVLPTPHKGIDFAATKGTPVYATASGIIVSAGALTENQGRYGNAIIIDHGGQRSMYAHLDSVNVQAGQRVSAGQRIGAVGQTGFATGPHLHLELRQGEKLLDPASHFADLDAHATAHALKLRRQQLPSKG